MVAGVKVASQTPAIRSGQRIIFLTLDDATGPVEVTVFESVQPKVAKTVFHGYALAVWGRAPAHRGEGGEHHRRGGLGPHRRCTGPRDAGAASALDEGRGRRGRHAGGARRAAPQVVAREPRLRRMMLG